MQDLIFPAVGQWVGAQREWDNLVAELKHELPDRLAAHLIKRAEARAQESNWAFVKPLTRRFKEIDHARRKESKNAGHKGELKALRHRLALMNPAAISRELAAGLTPPDLSEYNHIVADLAKAVPHPGIARRYALPPQALRALADQIAMAGRPVAQALSEHAQNLKLYSDLVARLRSQPLIQKGARIIGSAVASALEPLVGRDAAAQMLGVDRTLDRALEEVEAGWKAFQREFAGFVPERQRRFQLIYLSLVGGLFLRVQRDLRRMGCELDADAQGNCRVVPTADRQARLRQHLRAALPPIRDLLDAGQNAEAEARAANLVSQVVTDPVAARTPVDGKSVGYEAYAVHLSAVLARAREAWGEGRPEEAAAIWRQVFAEYPCLVHDADLHPVPGEPLPLVTAGFRLAAYAEWLRQSQREAEADALLLAQVRFVERLAQLNPELSLPGESLSSEMQEWAATLSSYLRRSVPDPDALDLPERALPLSRYPKVLRRFREAVGETLEVSPLDRYLRGRVNLIRGAAAAAATGGVGLLATLAWLLL